MKKIAIISDIHSNMTALDAILEDCEKEEVTDYFILGDLLMPGPGSSEMLKKLRILPNTIFVKGNWDSYFTGLPSYSKEAFENPTNIYGAILAKYQHKYLTEDDKLFIKNLPMFIEVTIDGVKFLICHHLPNKNNGGELLPHSEQFNFDSIVEGRNIDVAVYGHIHAQLLRYSTDGTIILNSGAVLKSPHANYLIVELDDGEVEGIIFKKVKYDIEKEIKLAKEFDLPYVDLYEKMLRTNIMYTHNIEVLEILNNEFGYKEEALKFLEDVNAI